MQNCRDLQWNGAGSIAVPTYYSLTEDNDLVGKPSKLTPLVHGSKCTRLVVDKPNEQSSDYDEEDDYEEGDYEEGDYEDGDNEDGDNEEGDYEDGDYEDGDNEEGDNEEESSCAKGSRNFLIVVIIIFLINKLYKNKLFK